MKVSIITVAYNSEATIERTIKSVLNQTYDDIEYVVVDGSSEDATIDIIKKYEPLFNGRIKWKSEPDSGIYDAMNKGVKRCSGDLIGIINSDDWLEQNAVEEIVKLAQVINDYRNCIFCGSLKFHYEDGDFQIFESNENRFIKGMKKHSFNHGAYHPAMFVGSDVYMKVGEFDTNFRICADIDFVTRCYQSGIRFIFTKSIVSNMSDGGASNKLNLKRIISDKKYEYKKRGFSETKASWTLFLFCTRHMFKSIVPQSIVRRIRNKRATS